jgi:hypothetical protein
MRFARHRVPKRSARFAERARVRGVPAGILSVAIMPRMRALRLAPRLACALRATHRNPDLGLGLGLVVVVFVRGQEREGVRAVGGAQLRREGRKRRHGRRRRARPGERGEQRGRAGREAACAAPRVRLVRGEERGRRERAERREGDGVGEVGEEVCAQGRKGVLGERWWTGARSACGATSENRGVPESTNATAGGLPIVAARTGAWPCVLRAVASSANAGACVAGSVRAPGSRAHRARARGAGNIGESAVRVRSRMC